MLSDLEIKAMSNSELNDLLRCIEGEIEYRENLPEKELNEYLNNSMKCLFEE